MMDELAALCPFALSPRLRETLERAYAAPPRAYHTISHVLEVARTRPAWPKESFAAVLFHDAIYEVGRADNEERSAQLAAASLQGLGLDLQRVQALIRLTARHGHLEPADVDPEAARFLDADMAILGAPPEAFARYGEQIALEYVPLVGEELYRAGRHRFLEGLLARPQIFLSDDFRARFEAQARRNLTDALR